MHEYYLVDAFSKSPLKGNPVAVFFAADDLNEKQMQAIASQMNLSECTFVMEGQDSYDALVRIFTPVNELAFAGHPLLGTALAFSIKHGKSSLRFKTSKGLFQFKVIDERMDGQRVIGNVEMEQPSPHHSLYERAEELLQAVKRPSSTLPVEMYDVGPRHVFVGLEHEKQLSEITPDLNNLATHNNMALLCFSPGTRHWRLRMFSPAYGVTEDAATGSAAGPFVLHLARHGLVPYGKKVTMLQGKEMGREAIMWGCATLNGEDVRLKAGGNAICMGRGHYLL